MYGGVFMDNLDHFVLDPMVRQLDWNLLRTYIMIVQEKSITLAANRLLLTQPAVSLALKKLEDRLSVQLIERAGKTFTITGEGEVLFREAVAIYSQIASLPAQFEAVRGKVTGAVNIVAASGAASDILSDAVEIFHGKYPDVALFTNISSSQNAIQGVRSKVVSLAICYVQSTLDTLRYDSLREVPFGLFCCKEHRLFGRDDVSLAELRGERFISFQTDPLADDLWPEHLLKFRREMEFQVVGSSSNLGQVYRMVKAGVGIGLFPISSITSTAQRGDLWQLPPYEQLSATIYLVTNPNKRWTLGELAFAEIVRSFGANGGGAKA